VEAETALRAAAPAEAAQADVFPFDEALDPLAALPCERCDVGVVFAQLADAEALALGRAVPGLRAALDALFSTAGEVTAARGGYTDRPELCAVQCVFRVAEAGENAADVALAAGRDLRDRLAERLPDAPFSIGVSLGASVAGWIGTLGRFEPMVIRAPVNEARQLCERARSRGASLLASERALGCASPAEADRWAPAALVGKRLRAATPA
jgi:hypothetical protein